MTLGPIEQKTFKQPLVLALSKQTRFICPQILILCGLIQNIPMFLRRRCAYTIPAVMAAGNAGGTVMVMMSRASMMIVLADTWGRQKGPSQELQTVLVIIDDLIKLDSSTPSDMHRNIVLLKFCCHCFLFFLHINKKTKAKTHNSQVSKFDANPETSRLGVPGEKRKKMLFILQAFVQCCNVGREF